MNQLVKAKVLFKRKYVNCTPSKSKEEAHFKVLKLYRDVIRKLPWIRQVYHVSLQSQQMRNRVREEIMKHAEVSDTRIIDSLLMSAYEKFEDINVHHAQRGHVNLWFAEGDVITTAPKNQLDPFLAQFLTEKMESDPFRGLKQ